jgi:hypothetical protein
MSTLVRGPRWFDWAVVALSFVAFASMAVFRK